jgi:2-dehydro-3-deoxyphosphogluconate aldolase / (4S)-4-hydroxy-2-oxoglutarate aldolase
MPEPMKSSSIYSSEKMLSRIGEGKIISILRGDYLGYVEQIVDVLLQSGINTLEITLNSPHAMEMIDKITSHCGVRLLVGAGTVMNEQEVSEAAQAGARFILSPNKNVKVITRTKELGLLSFPGCLTCTEIVEALDAGADAVKIFPAQSVSPQALRALRAPLGPIRTIPTGGVSPEQIRLYMAAGAWAFGIGSELINPAVTTQDGMNNLLKRAETFVNAVREGAAA